jgi:hypothetical protein
MSSSEEKNPLNFLLKKNEDPQIFELYPILTVGSRGDVQRVEEVKIDECSYIDYTYFRIAFPTLNSEFKSC